MEDKERSKEQLIVELARTRQRLAELESFEAALERAEGERMAAANYIQLLLEATDEGIYGLDAEGRCILINRSAAAMFGYQPQELFGKELHPLMHHTHIDGSPYPQAECPIFRAFRVGQGTRVDNEVFWRRDGSSFPVEYSSYPIIEDGVIKGAVVTFLDITERKRMVEALQKAREELESQVEKRTSELAKAVEDLRDEIAEHELAEEALGSSNEELRIYARVVDHSPDFISVIDRQYTYKMVNHTYVQMFLKPADEIIGHTVVELFGEDLFQSFFRPKLDRCLAGEATGYESWITLPTGPRYLETHYYPLPLDGQVEYVVVVARDATERQHAEEEREHLIEQLQTERARLEEVLRQMPAGVVIAEAPSGKLVLGNAQMEKIFRHPFLASSSIEEYREWKAFHPDGRPLKPEDHPLAHSIRMGEVVTGEEIKILRGDGTWGVINANSAPIRSQEGSIVAAVAAFVDVTDLVLARKQVEQLADAVQRRASELAAVFENTDAQLALLDRNFNFVMVNDSYVAGSGHTIEELVGRNHFDMFPDAENQTIFGKVRETGQPVSFKAKPFEYPDQPWRGTTYWDWTLVPVKDRVGQVQGLVLSLVDVTENVQVQQKREQLLRQIDSQRQLLQSVVENAPVGIAFLRGPDFVFEVINPTYQAIAPGKGLLRKTVAEAWPELASQVIPLLENVFSTGEPYSIVDAPLPVQRFPELPPEQAYFTFSYIPLRESDGQVNAILVLVIETTAQVRARQRIEELAKVGQRRSSELETIINSIADDVFVWDKERRIVDVNEAALRFLGLEKKEEAINLSADYLQKLNVRHLDGRPVASEERELARALRGEVMRDFEQIALDVHSGHDIYLLTSAAPVRDSAGNIVGAVVVNSDITHLKELDRLKDQFISVAAHELKTPVTIMKGYSQALLRAKASIPPSYARVLEAIDRGADRIDDLVGDLLDISQLQLGQLGLEIERIDLPVFVQQVIDRMALTVYKHNIRLVRAEPVVVQADLNRLEQVLVNLLDNAVRYAPQGGDIDVAVFVHDHEAVVSVRDYGIGIAREKQEHIFERFYRAHTGTPYDYGGMGVGLYISKEIITRHGGELWFESEEGKGSTFYVSLPIS